MKIVEKPCATKYFGNVGPGTVFHLPNNNMYYMKIAPISIECKTFYNAINLNFNEVRLVDNEQPVELVDCELVVK